jgi:predicted NBD/HSP70 family sugar kinase
VAAAVEEVVGLAQAGDAGAIGALAESGRWLGRGAALVCAMLDPGLLILGGHYSRLAPWILTPAREAFREAMLMPADAEQLVVSTLDIWAPAEGATLAVLMSIVDGATELPG